MSISRYEQLQKEQDRSDIVDPDTYGAGTVTEVCLSSTDYIPSSSFFLFSVSFLFLNVMGYGIDVVSFLDWLYLFLLFRWLVRFFSSVTPFLSRCTVARGYGRCIYRFPPPQSYDRVSARNECAFVPRPPCIMRTILCPPMTTEITTSHTICLVWGYCSLLQAPPPLGYGRP